MIILLDFNERGTTNIGITVFFRNICLRKQQYSRIKEESGIHVFPNNFHKTPKENPKEGLVQHHPVLHAKPPKFYDFSKSSFRPTFCVFFFFFLCFLFIIKEKHSHSCLIFCYPVNILNLFKQVDGYYHRINKSRTK